MKERMKKKVFEHVMQNVYVTGALMSWDHVVQYMLLMK